MGARRLFLGTLWGLLALSCGTARADPFEEFGLGARAQAMGNAFTAVATGPNASYYNPAGLIYSRHVNLQFGFSFADYFLTFDSDTGGALDDAAERIPDLGAFTLGFSSTIGIDVPDRLALGVLLFTPGRGIVDLESSATSDEPEWFRYGSRHDRLELFLSLALKVPMVKGLSIGAGAGLLAGFEGSTRINAGLSGPVTPDFQAKVQPTFRPVVGILYAPNDLLSIGITYRGETSVKIDFPASANFQGIDIPLNLEATQLFSPHQVQLGLSLAPTDSLLISFDFLWSNWSGYDDVFLFVSSSVASTFPNTDVSLQDVFSPRLGLEFVATDWLILRGGYYYRTTMVKDQDSKLTNLVDSPKHVFTFGVGFAFGATPEEPDEEKPKDGKKKEPKKKKRAQTIGELLSDASFDIDVFLQYHFHQAVSADKPTGAVGSWDADGGILNLGFTFTVRF